MLVKTKKEGKIILDLLDSPISIRYILKKKELMISLSPTEKQKLMSATKIKR